jgi:hypothetical protein
LTEAAQGQSSAQTILGTVNQTNFAATILILDAIYPAFHWLTLQKIRNLALFVMFKFGQPVQLDVSI